MIEMEEERKLELLTILVFREFFDFAVLREKYSCVIRSLAFVYRYRYTKIGWFLLNIELFVSKKRSSLKIFFFFSNYLFEKNDKSYWWKWHFRRIFLFQVWKTYQKLFADYCRKKIFTGINCFFINAICICQMLHIVHKISPVLTVPRWMLYIHANFCI